MKITQKILNDRIIYEHRDFAAVGVLGLCGLPLNKWSSHQNSLPEIEYFPVKHHKAHDILGMFLYRPKSHLEVVAYKNNDDFYSIFATGLDLTLAQSTFDRMIPALNFQVKQPNNDFIEEFRRDVNIQVQGIYLPALQIACARGITVERITGAARYANFLHLYRSISPREALECANRLFNLSEILDEQKPDSSVWN